MSGRTSGSLQNLGFVRRHRKPSNNFKAMSDRLLRLNPAPEWGVN